MADDLFEFHHTYSCPCAACGAPVRWTSDRLMPAQAKTWSEDPTMLAEIRQQYVDEQGNVDEAEYAVVLELRRELVPFFSEPVVAANHEYYLLQCPKCSKFFVAREVQVNTRELERYEEATRWKPHLATEMGRPTPTMEFRGVGLAEFVREIEAGNWLVRDAVKRKFKARGVRWPDSAPAAEAPPAGAAPGAIGPPPAPKT